MMRWLAYNGGHVTVLIVQGGSVRGHLALGLQHATESVCTFRPVMIHQSGKMALNSAYSFTALYLYVVSQPTTPRRTLSYLRKCDIFNYTRHGRVTS